MEIRDGKDCLPQVRELIGEYARWLGRDLRFQHLDEELKDPAAKYTPPAGDLLVLWEDGALLGMVAYHRHSAERCEMKRLYVRPQARGRGLGEALVARILERAKAAGYREMVLDTLAPMRAAISLYEKFGFRTCEAYYHNPFEDVIYMRKAL